ncbi:Protein kinase domain-containing protein [Trichoderma simmonsii]|uniref:Protein kinase domain-containing protein n=1 Tax=Trichoderma simmonsii TaxID=1491479 RepID=A0A8G0PD65_9HYPO|nr:Protein kinase domain-containing protein [Trichoderma simmonsii]
MSTDEPPIPGGFVLPPDTCIIDGKGEFVAAGMTSVVELLPNGDIIKTPWDNPFRDCVQDLTTEAKIYQMLAEHPRLVKIRNWDSAEHTMVMEFMPYGTLKQYIENHYEGVSRPLQLQWARQAAEGLQLLHAFDILHCDVGPHNFLLDASLNLKIADFSGSSINGSYASVCPGSRYRAPDPEWRPGKPPSSNEDLFALGSVLYFIFTGKVPFSELEEDEVARKYKAGVFPDLSEVLCSDIITLCWQQRAGSAQQIYEAIDRLCVAGNIWPYMPYSEAAATKPAVYR